MRRAQSMAQAAWLRPSLQLSSWSCMGPRRRPAVATVDSPESSSTAEAESISTALELPVSSSDGTNVWHSETTASYSDDEKEVDDLTGPRGHQDGMTEFELWQQIEHELYEQNEDEEADVAKEMREEEEAAIAEGRKSVLESNMPETKESHRFFPAGKIMHIVMIPQVVEEGGSDTSSSDTDKDEERVVEEKVGIFLTPRSLYSKLRLSHSMISDHFMPVYRRQIEKLILELEKKERSLDRRGSAEEIEVVL